MEHLSDDHAYALIDRTIIIVLRRPPTQAVIDAVEMRLQRAARTLRSRIAYLHVVLNVPTTGRVDDEIRRAFIATAKRSIHHVEGAAMVLLGEGFVGAAMRATMSGAIMLIRPTSPVRIFSSVDEGARWLATLSSPRDARTLLDKVAEMTAALMKDYRPTEA